MEQQLKAFSSKRSGNVCDAGDIAFWTGEAFNDAAFDGVEAFAYQNDRNRFGCRLDHLDDAISSRYHDKVKLEPYQLCRILFRPP